MTDQQRTLFPASWHSTFWSGALCGAAVVWIAEEMRRRRGRPRLVLVRNNAPGARTPRRDEGAGNPAVRTDAQPPAADLRE
jgi:hypothetical protein